FVYFFFQAEDGIRCRNVTGVQTCALPILPEETTRLLRRHAALLRLPRNVDLYQRGQNASVLRRAALRLLRQGEAVQCMQHTHMRSEERRAGKELKLREAHEGQQEKHTEEA